jgi:hypothetical protein
MKAPASVMIATLALGLAACSQVTPMPRDQIAANLVPILKIEKRSQRVLTVVQMLGEAGVLSGEILEDIKTHQDIYFVYYTASTVHLAGGDMKSYLAHVQLAESELDAMESLLKESIAKNADLKLSKDPKSPKLEL